MYPDKEAFDEVSVKLEAGEDLTLEMIGDVFGKEFYIMIIYLLLDSDDAARAIQGAMLRLKAGEPTH